MQLFKTGFKFLVFSFLSFYFLTLQTFNSSAQSNVCLGDTIYLELPVYTGTIQWQESSDSLNWDFILGATYQPFKVVAVSTKYYRAMVTEGTCNPIYSAGEKFIVSTCSFSCGNLFTDSRDGKTYNTVLIGTQCWMAQNLDYGTYVPIATTQAGAGTQKYCYDDLTTNCTTYGGLYEWAEMMNGSNGCNGAGAPPNDKCVTNVQGICPTGWHIPSHYEWTTLEKNVGSNPGAFPYDITTIGYLGADEGSNLKETGTSHWTTPNTGATNSSNFTALPGGFSWSNSFNSVGTDGHFWSATENAATVDWYRTLNYSNFTVDRGSSTDAYGFSVRCIQDCTPIPSGSNAGPNQLNLFGTTATLAANTPTNGTGQWSMPFGSLGSFADDFSPTTTFTGLAGTSYNLIWSITTACGISRDTVVVSFAFVCGTSLVQDYDGNAYNTVSIGSQCWMKENLRTTKYNNGTVLPNITNNTIWNTLTTGARSYYNNDSVANALEYGPLYNWYAVSDINLLCPTSWHVATDGEWSQLETTLGGISNANGKLKEAGTSHWTSPNTGATNESGFTALPGGSRIPTGTFSNIYSNAFFWTSTSYNSADAWYRVLYNSGTAVGRTTLSKNYGYSVRCIRDFELTIQQRLNFGETPKQIFDSGIPLDSLYGKTYQGGLIFYLNTSSGTGLVSAATDQSSGVVWGCNLIAISGADGTTIGTGNQNTSEIVSGCPTSGIAADICTITISSYSDWFLPSKDELNEMYMNLKLNGYGGFVNYWYWSSSEYSDSIAWGQDFNNGNQFGGGDKNSNYNVRAVRAF